MVIIQQGNIDFKTILVLLLGILFFTSVSAKTEKLATKYIIQMSGVSIGEFSVTQTSKNGQLNSTIWLKREKDSYLLISEKDTSVIHDLIRYSGSLIYFNEPKGIKKIYKERSAEMRPLEAVGEHTYIIKDEKGRELNRY